MENTLAKVIGSEEVAKILGISKNALSNLRKRDENFPKPLDINAGPVWEEKCIYEYGKSTGRITMDDFNILDYEYNSKKISIIGRARVGKSLLVSMFCNNWPTYRKIFTSTGSDKTFCKVENVFIWNDILNDYVEFKCEIKKLKEFKVDKNIKFEIVGEEVSFKDICNELECLNGCKFWLNEEEKIKIFLNRIKVLIEEINRKTENKCEFSPCIKVVSKPSEFCKDIMREIKINSTMVKKLEVVDIPGISGEIPFKENLKSDLYIFILRDDNSNEFKSSIEKIKDLAEYISASEVCFLYNNTGSIIYGNTLEECKEYFIDFLQKKAKESMESYDRELKTLCNDSIILNSMNILHPSQNCFCLPNVSLDERKPQEIPISEIVFRELFGEYLSKLLSKDYKAEYEKNIKSIINDNKVSKKDIESFANEIISSIDTYSKRIEDEHSNSYKKPYTIKDFKINRDRVKTNDNYEVYGNYKFAYRKEINFLYNKFIEYKLEKNNKNNLNSWKSLTIIYIYKFLREAVDQETGLGIGRHIAEEQPALTMRIEEAILGKEVLEAVTKAENGKKSEAYSQALIDGGVKSKSWDCVFCKNESSPDYKQMIRKLELIQDKGLDKIEVYSLYEMILCRYIGGLRALAEENILKSIKKL